MAFLLKLQSRNPICAAACANYFITAAGTRGLPSTHEPQAELHQQQRWMSRPRGPLWRGRKGIGKEALHVICDVKRVKDDSVKLGNTLQVKAARLLKTDLLAVLQELQRQHEVDIALKVFNMIRKEVWYKPDSYIYKDMLCCLAKNKRVTECEALLKDLKSEGLPPDGLVLTEIMVAYLECGMLPQAMETFEAMRRGSIPPDLPAFKALMRYLKKMGKKELRAKVRKECLEFYEGIVEDKQKQSMDESDESDEDDDLSGISQNLYEGVVEKQKHTFDKTDEESE